MNNTNSLNMSILFFVPGMNKGGAERVVSFLANKLVERGYLVTILVLGEGTSDYHLDYRVKLKGLEYNSKNKIMLVLKLRKFIENCNPDIIVCFSIKMTLYSILATSGKKIKIISSDRSNPYYAYGNLMRRGLYNKILSRANGFIFLTEGGREYYPIKIKKKSIVIPNGVFAESIPSKNQDYNTRKTDIICAVGRLSPVKNYHTMLKAFSIFLNDHPSYILHVYGDGELRQDLEEFTKFLKIDKSVKFLGKVDDIPNQIKNAGMFIHTSKSESWCNALMEAMACGIPSIAMDCDFGPRAMIKDHYNGELVTMDDIDEFSQSMSKIADSDSYGQYISDNAYKINYTHNPEKIFDLYLNYFKGIYHEN